MQYLVGEGAPSPIDVFYHEEKKDLFIPDMRGRLAIGFHQSESGTMVFEDDDVLRIRYLRAGLFVGLLTEDGFSPERERPCGDLIVGGNYSGAGS